MRGSATVTNRSRNSHIRAPRSVTAAPISCPSRSPKLAIDFFALRAHRLLAGDHRQLLDDVVEELRLLDRLADADVEHDLRRASGPGAGSSARTASSAARAPSSRSSSRRRGAGTGSPAPACGPRAVFGSPPFFVLLSLFGALRAPLAPFFSFVAIDLSSSRSALAGIASPLLTLRRSLVPSVSMRRRVRVGSPDLRIEQHHVRRVDRRRHLDDPALLLRAARLAVLLHDVRRPRTTTRPVLR